MSPKYRIRGSERSSTVASAPIPAATRAACVPTAPPRMTTTRAHQNTAPAIYMHRAGPARGDIAPKFGSCKFQLIADQPQKRCTRFSFAI